MVEDGEFQDVSEVPNWNIKKDQTKSYKEIVLSAIEKCRTEGSKQMVKGIDVMHKDDKTGQFIPVHLPDQRKIFEECVNQLKFLLVFYYDDEAKTKIYKLENDIKSSYDECLKSYLEIEIYEPHLHYSRQTRQIHPKSIVGNNMLQQMEDYILEQYQNIYLELLLLFKRKNELSNKRTVPLY